MMVEVCVAVAESAVWHHVGELRNSGLELLRLGLMPSTFFAQSKREASVSSREQVSDFQVIGLHRSEVRNGGGLRSAQVRVVGNELGDKRFRRWFDRFEAEGLGMRARTRERALCKGPGALLQTC